MRSKITYITWIAPYDTKDIGKDLCVLKFYEYFVHINCNNFNVFKASMSYANIGKLICELK